MMEKFANVILKHSKLVIILWVILLLCASPFVVMYIQDPGKVVKYEITDMDGADSESYEGMQIIGKDSPYFSGSGTDYVVVCNYSDEDEKNAIENEFYKSLKDKLDIKYDKKEVLSQTSVPKDKSGMVLITLTIPGGESKNDGVEFLRSTIIDIQKTSEYKTKTYVTGGAALTYDISKSAMEDVMKIDPFSILLVLILIGLFFMSIISAATPPLTIGVAYAVVLMAVFFIGQTFDVFYITTTLVLISMLGAGCDYCIFIIARYREERKNGKNQDDALKEAIMWAGESVMVSGLCVIIGFGIMSLCSFSLISTMGMVLAVGIIFALLAAVTLIPSIIHLIGDRIFFPANIESYKEGSKASKGWYGKVGRMGQRYFRSSAKFSIKHAWAIVIAAIVITAPLAYVALTEKTSFDMISTMPNSDSKQGINEITDNGQGGMTMPTYVLMNMNIKDGELVNINKEHPVVIHTDDKDIELYKMEWNDQDKAKKLTIGTWFYSNDDDFFTSYLFFKLMEKSKEGINAQIYQKNNDNISLIAGVVDWNSLIDVIVEISEEIGHPMTPDQVEEEIIGMIGSMFSSDIEELLRGIKTMYPNDYPSIYNYIINTQLLDSISNPVDGRQYIKLTVMFKDQPMSDKSMETATLIREATKEYEKSSEGKELLNFSDKYATYTTGTTALLNDISDQVKGDFTIIEIIVVILILLLLMFVMKSYLTPVRSVVTIIMSVMWTLGFTHLLFGSILHQPIIWMVPIVLFVICLGLGMDYDVLLTTRIKEYVGRGMDNDTAIEQAVEHSGAIITICGFIMGGAFLTMILSTTPMLQQFGFALGFAILVDALLIRTYVVPAVMHLLGKWNWVGPKFLQKSKG